ncbi:Neopullulanase 2 [compost metagenome]
MLLEFFARQSIGAAAFMEQAAGLYIRGTDSSALAMLNLLDSHDTERFLTSCRKGGWGWQPGGGAEERLKLAMLFLMTYPGIPMIYYGAEVGMEGETDPGCRKPMVWEPTGQNLPLKQYYRQLIALRRERTELQTGSFSVWLADEALNQAGFIRKNSSGETAVLLHNNPSEAEIELPLPPSLQGRRIRELLTGQTWEAGTSVRLHLPPYSGFLFSAETL